MTSKERVLHAFAHVQPDHTPCDYYATPEIHRGLCLHFGVSSDEEARERLGVDIRYVNPPYVGPTLPRFDDGSAMDVWGVRKKPMANEYGDYAEAVNMPFAEWTTVDEAARYTWPDSDWYDYDAVPELCDRFPDLAIGAGGYFVQDFINGVAFGRGVEQVLIDIAAEDPVYLYIVEKRHRFFMEFVERTLRAAAGKIDFVLCGDDFGSQRGLLISPSTFDKLFAQKKKEFFDMVHSYKARVSHHSCGSTVELIPRFIELGMDALQTIQPTAEGMNPYRLKERFSDRITFHGGVDVQGWLQRAPRKEIHDEVSRLLDEMGRGGGYILGPSHNIQPDTPLENVLEVYRTISKRRGGSRRT